MADMSYLAVQDQFIVAVKVIVGTTCVLSVLGASLIVLTYVMFKNLRTTARQLLVNLSVADIFVAGSHFVGLFTNYDRFVYQFNPTTDTFCTVQAAFTMCGTLASFLWTVAIGLYMFIVIVRRQPHVAKKLVYMFYPVCWGIPIVLTTVFGANMFLGFERNSDIGWCYFRLIPDGNSSNSTNSAVISNHSKTLLAAIFGYEIWVYVTFISLLLLYITTHCHVRHKVTKAHSSSSRAVNVDLKLIFVPLIFLLLRLWSGITDVPVFYLSDSKREAFSRTNAAAIILLLAGVGDSAQGLANSILFCIFTKQVRQKLLTKFKCLLCHCCINVAYLHHTLPENDTHEDTTTFGSYYETGSEHTGTSHYVENPVNPLLDVSCDSNDVFLSEERSYGTILCRNEVIDKRKHPTK